MKMLNKLLIIIFLLFVSCGSEKNTSSGSSYGDTILVKYKVYINDIQCAGYPVYNTFIISHLVEDVYIQDTATTFIYEFHHQKNEDLSLHLEVDSQGKISCNPIHAEIYIDNELVAEEIGSYTTETFQVEYEYIY